MELFHLRCFVSVAEELSFTRASERLHIATSAVSQRIRDLERHLGKPLFTRSSRHVEITETGAGLLPLARDVLARFDAIPASVGLSTLDRPTGTLGVTPDVSPADLRLFVAQFRRTWPDTELQIRPGLTREVLQDLVLGRCDAGLLSGSAFAPGLRYARLSSTPVVAVVPSGLGFDGRSVIDLCELACLPYVSLAHDCSPFGEHDIDDVLAQAGVLRRTTLDRVSAGNIVHLVSSGHAFAFVTVGGTRAKMFTDEPVTFVTVRGFDLSIPTCVAWTDEVATSGVRHQFHTVAGQLAGFCVS